MSCRHAILAIVFCSMNISIPSSADAQAWKPYDFKGTEHFRYDIKSIDDGEEKTGSFTLDIEKKDEEQYKISFASKLGDSESSSSMTSTPDEIAGKLMMSMMMSGSEAGAILGVTIFTPALGMMFMGAQDLEVGSGWSRTEDGKKVSFKIEEKETIAGQEGYRCVLREEGRIKYLQVIAPDIGLPLVTQMNDDDGTQFEAKLVEFKR